MGRTSWALKAGALARKVMLTRNQAAFSKSLASQVTAASATLMLVDKSSNHLQLGQRFP